jgi:hypothetical protein
MQNALPPTMQKLMPVKGQAGLRMVANDRTLFVTIPKDSENFPCSFIARYVLHAAQDGGYGKICVLKGVNHKHYFNVIDVVKRVRAWSGPSMVGLTKFRNDCWLDERKKIWVLGHKPNPNATISLGR